MRLFLQEFQFLKLAHSVSCLRTLLQKSLKLYKFFSSPSYFALVFRLQTTYFFLFLPYFCFFTRILSSLLMIKFGLLRDKAVAMENTLSSSSASTIFLSFYSLCFETRSFSFLLPTINVCGLLLLTHLPFHLHL